MVENQYIDLFTSHRETIDKKSADILNQQRDSAFISFKKQGFPNSKLEDYQNTNASKEFESDLGLNINQILPNIDPYTAFKCSVPELGSNLYFLINDTFNRNSLPNNHLPDKVFIGGLKDFAEKHPDICAKYYAKAADNDKNGLVAYNTLFAQDGFVIYVPDNVIVEQPIQLMNILMSNVDFQVNRRILLIAGKNAQFKVLACDHTVDNSKFVITQVTEIFADENAHVDYYELEDSSDNTVRFSNTFIQIQKNANVLTNNTTLHCGLTRNNYYIDLLGEYAEGYISGVVVAGEKQHVDNFIFVNHAKPNCHSNQLYKYVLQDNSTGVFCGRILVAEDAQKTLAYQSNNNLCVSPTARMYSKPQLEIYADDVKCSHGLTTGQLDEEALFYMRTRGIHKDEAKLILMQAFTSTVLDMIRLEPLKERLTELIEKRFKGETARCGDCAICK